MREPSKIPGVDEYILTDAPIPHLERAKLLLERYPKVRELLGPNPWTAACAVGLVLTQCSLGWALADAPVWQILVAAWLVGAFLSQGLWVVIHECGHGAVFRSRVASNVLTIVANLPMTVPSGISFNLYHAWHHAARGVYEEDADLAGHWEARLVGRSVLGKVLWELNFWLIHALRCLRFSRSGRIRFLTPWVWANIVIGFAFDGVIVATLGPRTLLFLAASMVFGIGLHPLGARWIQEHFVVRDGQETYSYYGALNWVTFNVGYHNEHHDLPGVPWNRLPKLKAMAPEMYEPLYAHRSWLALWLRFLVDRNLTLYSRIRRSAG